MADQSFTIDFGAPITLGEVPALARRAFVWWVTELKSLAPAWARHVFPKPPQVAVLLVQGDVWRIVPDGDDERALVLDATAGDKELADQILSAAPNFSLQRLTVVLQNAAVLRRRIELPTMAEGDVRSAVELQIDRLTPFKSDVVRFAARIASRDRFEGKLTADVVVAAKSTVEAVEQRLNALGLMAAAIDVDGGNGSPAGFDLRAPRATSTPRRQMLINAGFVAGAALAWYAAGLSLDTAREREVAAWQERIEAMRPLAQRSATLRRKFDAMTQPFALARAHKPGLTLAVLAELTRILPDTARLTELRMTRDTLILTGLAQDAPALIARLDASSFFKEVKFLSPVVRRPEVGKDRFELSFRLEQGAPK